MNPRDDDNLDLPESRQMQRETETGGEEHSTSDVSEVSALVRHRDPSHQKQDHQPSAGDRQWAGVVWVRPTELLASSAGRVAARGINFHAELARRTRILPAHTVAASRRAIGERALRLPPVSAFGRSRTAQESVSRAGAGLR